MSSTWNTKKLINGPIQLAFNTKPIELCYILEFRTLYGANRFFSQFEVMCWGRSSKQLHTQMIPKPRDVNGSNLCQAENFDGKVEIEEVQIGYSHLPEEMAWVRPPTHTWWLNLTKETMTAEGKSAD